MQLMPGTAASLGVTDPYDPRQNIMGGAKYVAELMEMFQGYENALELVIAGYNAGPQAVINAGYQIPPYTETQNHVKKVMGYIQILEQPSGTGSSSDTEGSPEELEKSYQLLKNAVTEYVPQFFSWSVYGRAVICKNSLLCDNRSWKDRDYKRNLSDFKGKWTECADGRARSR